MGAEANNSSASATSGQACARNGRDTLASGSFASPAAPVPLHLPPPPLPPPPPPARSSLPNVGFWL